MVKGAIRRQSAGRERWIRSRGQKPQVQLEDALRRDSERQREPVGTSGRSRTDACPGKRNCRKRSVPTTLETTKCVFDDTLAWIFQLVNKNSESSVSLFAQIASELFRGCESISLKRKQTFTYTFVLQSGSSYCVLPAVANLGHRYPWHFAEHWVPKFRDQC